MSFLEQLNAVQRDAVSATDGPVMIVAGAGSGKTRVLTFRAAYLLQRGIRADAVLALTFTNKAADEMKSRIAELIGPASRGLWMGTFHSIFARILRLEAGRIGYQRTFSIYDTDDSLGLIKGIMNDLSVSQQQYAPSGIRSRISMAKNSLIPPAEYRRTARDTTAVRTGDIYEEYNRRLLQLNAMDFDDLLLKPLDLFTEHPDVLARYQQRFTHILVDEYQDTNRVQYRLLKALAAGNKNICVVGDDAQSIYAFRGADIRNILDFEKDYPECRVFRLEQNYRSTKTILGAADSLIRHNVDQIPKQLWTSNADGDLVSVDLSDDDREEGRRIVQHIEEETRRRKLGLNDFAVLYRTNAQSRVIEDALRRSSIPYVIVGGIAFYKRKEIKDILAYLRFLSNPRDDESLLRILNVPVRSIGQTTIQRIRSSASAQNLTLFQALPTPQLAGLLSERIARAVLNFSTLLKKYLDLKEHVSVSELIRALVDEIGILQLLKDENTPESLARRENILELVSALTEFTDLHPDARLEDFLSEVSLVSEIDMTDFGRNAVTLMTLHAAKGLEFAVVFITGLEEGLLPISQAIGDRLQVEEERRLMYVGMTRAKQRLYLSHALTRYHQGDVLHCLPSRFLEEIDALFLAESAGKPVARRSSVHVAGRTGIGPDQPVHARRKPPAHEPGGFHADPAPQYEDESQDTEHIRVGMHVEHETFGRGCVVALGGRGDDARAVVDFASVGRKHLMLKFARLRPG
jgi:DNA helicase-2/ATP-dependent DNA helicase PcrA